MTTEQNFDPKPAELTPEQIAQVYSAAMDSVNLLNAGRPHIVRTISGGEDEIIYTMSEEEWADTVARNKEHLNIMLAKDFWTTEDLTPLQAAAE